jgi:hypothetical protein
VLDIGGAGRYVVRVEFACASQQYLLRFFVSSDHWSEVIDVSHWRDRREGVCMTVVKRSMLLGVLVLIVALIAPLSAAAAPGGNAAAARACQKDGYTQWTTADGLTFKNAGQCTSYAARGGVLTPVQKPVETLVLEFDMSWDVFGEGTLFIEGSGLAAGSQVAATLSGSGSIVLGSPVAVADVDGAFFVFTSYSGCVRVQFSGLAEGNVPFTTPTYAAPACVP